MVTSTTPVNGPIVATGAGQSQTLHRGLRVLEVLAGYPAGLGVVELAKEIGAHRTVVYRLLGTLRAHGLVSQAPDGRYRAGLGLLTLSAAVHRDLRSTARPHLARLADALDATAFLTLGDDAEAVSACVVEPHHAGVRVSYRVGVRHPLTVSAAGLAILSARPAVRGERAEVAEGRRRGYVVTSGELQPGAWGLAAPLPVASWDAEACIGVIALTELNEARTAVAVHATARAIADSALWPPDR